MSNDPTNPPGDSSDLDRTTTEEDSLDRGELAQLSTGPAAPCASKATRR